MASISNLTTTDGPLWDSPSNHGPVVSVLTWLLIVVTFLAVVARIATRIVVVRTIRMDDIFILLALLFAVGQSVAVSLETAAGLGQHIDALSPSQVTRFQKGAYAADILYVIALGFTKASVVLYLNSLTPIRGQRSANFAIGALTGLWALSSVFVLAFKCQLPQAWDEIHGKCIDVVAFWTYFDVLNMLTDMALIAMPFVILAGLQMRLRRKVIILVCFCSRIATVAVTAVQLYYLHHDTTYLDDLPFDLWTLVLVTQVVQAFSIITACVPYLKPFLEALETGMIRADGGTTTRKGLGSNYASNSNSNNRSAKGYNKYSNGKGSRKESRTDLAMARQDAIALGQFHPGDPKTQTATISARGRGADSDADSQSSQSKIIKKQIDWTLTDEQKLPMAV